MAKRVGTPLINNDLRKDQSLVTEQPKKQVSRIVIIMLIILAVVVVSFIIITATSSVANEQRETTEHTKLNSENEEKLGQEDYLSPSLDQAEPVTEPEPVGISFSGAGMSATDEFELPGGIFLINYEYSNNVTQMSYGPLKENYVAKVMCANTNNDNISLSVYGKTIVNDFMNSSGNGKKYLDLRSADRCYYQVESASANAKWSIQITEQVND